MDTENEPDRFWQGVSMGVVITSIVMSVIAIQWVTPTIEDRVERQCIEQCQCPLTEQVEHIPEAD